MVSSEGLVRGIDRTLEYAEYTEEERPVQIFGGDPAKMAAAPRWSGRRRHCRHQHGLSRAEIEAQRRLESCATRKRVRGCSGNSEGGRIPVTVKMRAVGDASRNAKSLRVACRMPARRSDHPRTDGGAVVRVSRMALVPMLPPPDDSGPRQRRLLGGPTAISGVLVGRGVLRNPWISPRPRSPPASPRAIHAAERGQFSSTTSTCWSASGRRRRTGSATSRPERATR